jgi:dephospho-CoA kinase
MDNKKIIIGLAGEIASGKTTATEYLKEKYNAVSFRFSDPLREILKILYLPETRENLQYLSIILRKQFGEDVLSKAIAEKIKNSDKNLIVIEGIRRINDMEYTRDLPNFYLIYLKSETKKRFDRVSQRTENLDDKGKTWEEFQKDEQRDTEQTIRKTLEVANFIIENDKELKNLYNEIDEIMKKIL